LTIDLITKKVFWLDIILKCISAIDFEGRNFNIVFQSEESFSVYSNYFIDIFGDDIYWSQPSFRKISKFGRNETRFNKFSTAQTDYFRSFKIIDSSLQPNSINRCFNNNCSHLCIPISLNQYRCVCPQNLRYKQKICKESVRFQISDRDTNSPALRTYLQPSDKVKAED
jgi:hypothetical protein